MDNWSISTPAVSADIYLCIIFVMSTPTIKDLFGSYLIVAIAPENTL